MTLEYAAGRVRGGGGSVVSRVGEPVARGPVVVLVGLLLVAAIWRLVLAMEILAKPTLENNLGALVAWRELDVFAGAVGLLVLAAASRRWAAAATVLSAAGAVLAGLGLLMEETGAGMTVTDGFSRAGTVALVMGAAVLVLRELRAVSVRLEKAGRSGEGGVDLIDLWRVVTVQWVLVWAAAEAILRFRYSSLDLAGNPGARMLLFLLPAVGLAPNVMMWVMLGWGGRLGLYGAGKVGRPRAWVVAMLAVNVGAVDLRSWTLSRLNVRSAASICAR